MIQIKEDSFLIYPFEYLESVSATKMVVVLKKKKLMITGKNLMIDYYSSTEIIGKGKIEVIQFLKKS